MRIDCHFADWAFIPAYQGAAGAYCLAHRQTLGAASKMCESSNTSIYNLPNESHQAAEAAASEGSEIGRRNARRDGVATSSVDESEVRTGEEYQIDLGK